MSVGETRAIVEHLDESIRICTSLSSIPLVGNVIAPLVSAARFGELQCFSGRRTPRRCGHSKTNISNGRRPHGPSANHRYLGGGGLTRAEWAQEQADLQAQAATFCNRFGTVEEVRVREERVTELA